MLVAAIQFDIVWEDKAANHRIIEGMLDDAALSAGTFLVLPELADTGFSMNLDAIVDDASLDWAKDCAQRRQIWIQHGYPRMGSDGKGRNCASLISPTGDITGTYEKLFPFSYGREGEFYSSGDRLLLRPVNGATICPLICYDLRFPELWRLATLAGTEVFTIGASWPTPRQTHWRQLLIARAIENQSFIIASNRIGKDPHLDYSGGSMIIAPSGEILAEANDRPAVIQATLNLQSLPKLRHDFPFQKDIRPDLLGSIGIDSE